MSESHLFRITRGQLRQAEEAQAEIREAVEEAGCRLPHLTLVPPDPMTGVAGVDLGMVESAMVLRLAEVIRAGVDALAAEDRPEVEATVTPLQPPNIGDPVVDLSRGMVGTYSGPDDKGWSITPLFWGEPWTADPKNVRTATLNEQVRAEHPPTKVG
ncbi:hypothetical protein OG196_15295 [Kitasatospora purpeofusca]|uniref:hypothetical protein n=1 Tax=Kitasatospora purpeofusca TaxID=67352 RepID=UPI002E1656DF|nr:hypothetical protein OG196_15295 [Kitasatospora purpeofusca]